MTTNDRVTARLQLLDRRLQQLRRDRDRLLARANQAERRRETRRKIVLGGTVLAAIEREGVPSLRTADDLRRWLDGQLRRPHDRAVFDLVPPRSA